MTLVYIAKNGVVSSYPLIKETEKSFIIDMGFRYVHPKVSGHMFINDYQKHDYANTIYTTLNKEKALSFAQKQIGELIAHYNKKMEVARKKEAALYQ